MTEDPRPVHLSVVIPAYNEAPIIAETLRRVGAYLTLKGWPGEILVSTDGSTDGTDAAVAATAAADPRVRLLRSDRNHGKGYAVRQGVRSARGRYVLFTDADLSTPIKEFDKLLAAMERGARVAVGSRAVRSPGADVIQSAKRRLSGRIFNALVRAIALEGVKDTQCGFKAFPAEAARELFAEQAEEGFAFDVELLCLAARRGWPVAEVPVMWKQGPRSKVRLGRDSWRMLQRLWALRRRFGRRLTAPSP
jgi:dolichyl-phosphate beta-glucosyltransferase